MFLVGAGMRDDEQAAQLQELNSRLADYLSRVRQLEQENHYLVEEIESLRLYRDVEWKRGYEAEMLQLREQVDALVLEKSRAEIERDGLWREFQMLQVMCEEVQALRREIDKELALHRAELKQAEDGRRTLEELLLRLQAEHQALMVACEQEAADLRGGVLGFTVEVVRHKPASTGLSLSLREVESYALEVSETWKETFLLYQRQVEELEDMLRASEESLDGVEAEKRRQGLQMAELEREVEELHRLRLALEEELGGMREKFMLEVEDYQILIESLEDEKQSLALSVSDRLKDYQELMQTKTGLSLEVATYRETLLEGESNQGMFTWSEGEIRKRPQGSRAAGHEYTTNYLIQQRDEARRFFPAVQSSVDTRHKTHLTQVSSTVPRAVSGSHAGGSVIAVRKEVPFSIHRPSASVREKAYQSQSQSQTGFQAFSGTGLPRYTENYRPVLPIPVGRSTAFSVQESTRNFQKSSKDMSNALRPGISQTTKTKMENVAKSGGHEQSFVLRGRQQVKGEGQVRLKENTKEDRTKVSRQNLPDDKTKRITATKVERNVALFGKPARATSYVFEIPTKNTAMSENIDLRQERLRHIDVPIQIIGIEKVQEKNQGDNWTQMERKVTENEQGKLDGDDAHKAVRIIEIPIQVMGRRQTEAERTRINESQGQVGWTVTEEVKEHTSAAGESYVESEERIRRSESPKEKTSGIMEEKSDEDAERDDIAPVSFDILGEERVLENNSIWINSRDSAETGSNAVVDKPAENVQLNVPKRESGLDTLEDTNKEHSSKMATSWPDELAEHVTVADILKHFGQSTGPEMTDGTSPDVKVTYSEKKQLADDGTVTTEIIVQSTTEEDFDLSDEEELEQLLNSSLEKATLKHLKGMHTESFLGNILHGGLKGKTGVRVEITEEPMESATDDQGEFSIPFQVEEADDAPLGLQGDDGGDEEAAHSSMGAHGFKDTTKPSDEVSRVEDVSEGGDTGEDLEYIVSTPDDFPVAAGEHDDSLYGKVHFEQESSVRYSWQDEVLQSSQNRKTTSDLHENDNAIQTCHPTSEHTRTYVIEEKLPRKEAAFGEGLVIEKEIKIPQEFQTSIKGLLAKELKDPNRQLKGALEKLEECLPGILSQELSALTTEDQEDANNLAVDIKKVEQTADDVVVTIVAEINVSQTFEVDKMDVLNNLESSANLIEGATLQSPNEEVSRSLMSHRQENDGKAIEIDASTSGNHTMRWSYEQLYSSPTVNGNNDLLFSTVEESLQERPSADPAEPSPMEEVNQKQMSADTNTFVRHIKLGPTEIQTTEHVIFEGPIPEMLELGTAGNHSPTEGTTDVSRSVRHFTLDPIEVHTENVPISERPSSETLEFDGEFSQTEGSTGVNRSIRLIKVGPKEGYSSEQIIFEGPISETQVLGSLSSTEEGADISRYIQHINLGAKEIQPMQQIVFEGPIGESPENSSGVELSSNANISVKHITLSPTEIKTTEQIILKGPLSQSSEHAELAAISEAGIGTSIRHITLRSKTHPAEQIIFEGPLLEPSADSSTFVRHIRLSPKDFQNSEQIIFDGSTSESLGDLGECPPVKEKTEMTTSTRHIKIGSREIQAMDETFEHPILERQGSNDVDITYSDDSMEANRPIRHIKLGPTEKSFTFQMDVTQLTTAPTAEGETQEATMSFSSRKLTEESDDVLQEEANEADQKDVESSNGDAASVEIAPGAYNDYFQDRGQKVVDTSMLDKTVQLHRMVDRRSMISDDKKVAIVYLDHEEEF